MGPAERTGKFAVDSRGYAPEPREKTDMTVPFVMHVRRRARPSTAMLVTQVEDTARTSGGHITALLAAGYWKGFRTGRGDGRGVRP